MSQPRLTVVERATAKDPDARFQSAGALGDAAIDAAGGPPRGAVPGREGESRQATSITHADGRETRNIVEVGDAKLSTPESTVRAPSSIFLCYRRDDSRWAAGRLADALRDRFGPDSVFVDVRLVLATGPSRSIRRSQNRPLSWC